MPANDPLLALYLRDHHIGCPECGYSLKDLESEQCPECGARLSLRVTLEATSLPTETERARVAELLAKRDIPCPRCGAALKGHDGLSCPACQARLTLSELRRATLGRTFRGEVRTLLSWAIVLLTLGFVAALGLLFIAAAVS